MILRERMVIHCQELAAIVAVAVSGQVGRQSSESDFVTFGQLLLASRTPLNLL